MMAALESWIVSHGEWVAAVSAVLLFGTSVDWF
jgi:hypothetical protein